MEYNDKYYGEFGIITDWLAGIPNAQSCLLKPKQIPKLKNVSMALCGSRYTVAVTQSGAVFTWGYGNYGYLGHGTRSAMREHMISFIIIFSCSLVYLCIYVFMYLFIYVFLCFCVYVLMC